MNKLNKIIRKNYAGFSLADSIFYIRTKSLIVRAVVDFVIISPKNEFTILDVGGNIGLDLNCVVEYLQHLGKGSIKLRCVVIDKDLKFYNLEKRFGFIEYYEEDFLTFDKRIFADVVICSEVIEHIWDKDKELFFKKINQLLEINGLLVMSTPNASSLPKNLYAIRHMNKNSFFFDDFQTEYHHKGVPTIYQALSILHRKGFDPQGVKFTAISFSLNKRKVVHKLMHYFSYLLPAKRLCSTNLVYIAKKISNIDSKKWYNQNS